MRLSFRYTIYAVVSICLVWLLSACRSTSPSAIPTLTPSPVLVATATLEPTATPTATPNPPTVALLAPPGADQELVNLLQTELAGIVTRASLRFQVRGQLTNADLDPSLKLVVVLPPDPGLKELASAAPATQFLAVGIPGLEASSNLTVIDSQSDRPDQQGFIAGVIAAMLSADWRVGVISISDTTAGKAARTGFLNGVEYFCGLCRSAHPPFYEYPLYIELPTTATSAEWQEAANYMSDHDALAVYVSPGVDQVVLTTLAKAGIKIIASQAPPDALQANWAVSLTSDLLPLLQDQVQGLLDGSISAGSTLDVPIQFTHINSSLLTPGKQRLAEQILKDLQDGYIDTGVDVTTGENRP